MLLGAHAEGLVEAAAGPRVGDDELTEGPGAARSGVGALARQGIMSDAGAAVVEGELVIAAGKF